MKHGPIRIFGLLCAGILLAETGCTGIVAGRDPGGDSRDARPSGPSDIPVRPGECGVLAPPLEARLMSPSQYDHTATDLLGFESREAAATFGTASSTPRSLARLDDLTVERLAGAAERVAKLAVSNLGKVFPCPAESNAADACVQQWIAELGERAFRRPIGEAELTQFTALFAAGAAEGNAAIGVEWLLTGVLQSPDFLYRMVVNDAGSAAAMRDLSGYEFATRLSYFLWDSMPDPALMEAAKSGTLTTTQGLHSELERMLNHQHFERTLRAFYDEWLGLQVFGEVARDHADFNQKVIDSLRESVALGIRTLYEEPAPNIGDLLTSTKYYMNDELSRFYGVPIGETGFTAVDLGQEGRRGIITHPALMTALARPDQTFPIGRGLFVLESLLCEHLEAPTNVDIPPLGPIPVGGSERDQLVAHTQGSCQHCHSLIDPLGFAFQDFDEVGRLRNPALDTSGTVETGGDLDGYFANGKELFERIGQSKTVRECFALHFFEFALARTALIDQSSDPVSDADACSLEPIQHAFLDNGDLKQLIVSIAESQAFRRRFSEGAQ